MTDELNSNNGRMPDHASPKQGGGSSTSGGQPKFPASIVPMRDPDRRDYGDRTEDESRKLNPKDDDANKRRPGEPIRNDDAQAQRPDEQHRKDGGEGHKGPRTDAKTGHRDEPSRSDRSDQDPQPTHPPRPMPGHEKPNSPRGSSPKDGDGKSGRSQDSGSGK